MDIPKNSCCAVPRCGATPIASHPAIITPRGHRANTDSSAEMAYIPAGEFWMGTNDGEGFPADAEGPVHKIRLDAFYIDTCAVTNSEFQDFVSDTGYVTEAERFGWSYVFHLLVPDDILQVSERVAGVSWWVAVKGACWERPEGPGSNVAKRLDHPVVHVSWSDALVYCQWAGKRLPTEAEWEYAARGGLEQNRYAWGNTLHPDGKHMCNIWQGKFPEVNHAADGYLATAPVRAFGPNGYGLYNVCGNVWEWCHDWFSTQHVRKGPAVNPKGPSKGTARVIKGGSYLCHRSYCNRYRVAARSSNTPDSSTGHMGFRCVKDA